MLPRNIQLNNSQIIFYPAQFWPHKNHIRLLQATLHLKDKGFNFKVELSGTDKGNLNSVKEFIHEKGLEKDVRLLGYISDEEIAKSYNRAQLVVIPSYLGPNMMPILESWYFKRPLIASKVFENEYQTGALYFDPNSFEDLAKEAASAISRLSSPGFLIVPASTREVTSDLLSLTNNSGVAPTILETKKVQVVG